MMIIGLTDPMKEGPTLGLYIGWIKGDDPDIDIRVFSYAQGNAHELAECHALVLSGGNDVDPQLYGRTDAWDVVKDVDEQRDRFEIALINSALAARLPVLGICRGAQIFNVARGGSLVPDLVSAGFQDHRRSKEGEKLHGITIARDSALRAITGQETAEVNTSHHQAIDQPGKGLAVTARSADGVVEAAEWEQPEGKPFLLLVQWHPERMTDARSPVAGKIRQHFVTHIRPTPHHHT
jgi:putative glutamine amidotransferase